MRIANPTEKGTISISYYLCFKKTWFSFTPHRSALAYMKVRFGEQRQSLQWKEKI